MKYFLSLLLVSFSALAQIPLLHEPFPSEDSLAVPELVKGNSPIETVIDQAKKISEVKSSEKDSWTVTQKTKENRESSFGTFLGGYQFITTWIPSKKSISYTQIFSQRWSLELEYSWSQIDFPVVGIDLGKISEKRYSLLVKRYLGHSFYLDFGPYLNEFEADLGSDVADISGSDISGGFEVAGVGAALGVGHRWQWGNGLTLGIDWVRLHVPVRNTKTEDRVLKRVSEDDKEDAKKVIRAFNNIPTFVLFGFKLGYTF